jgi:hypothetical protein
VHAPAREGDGDGAVVIGAVDGGAGGPQVTQHTGMGVAERVVGPDADDADLGVDGLVEPLGVGVTAVVGHLQHRRG